MISAEDLEVLRQLKAEAGTLAAVLRDLSYHRQYFQPSGTVFDQDDGLPLCGWLDAAELEDLAALCRRLEGHTWYPHELQEELALCAAKPSPR